MQASLGFFEILLIILFSFYLFGWLSRLLLPFLARAYMKRLSKRFGFQMPDEEPPRQETPGKITVKPTQPAEKKGNLDHVGEYADYEEIKD